MAFGDLRRWRETFILDKGQKMCVFKRKRLTKPDYLKMKTIIKNYLKNYNKVIFMILIVFIILIKYRAAFSREI